MSTSTTLRGSPDVGRALESDQIETNVISFLQWGLLAFLATGSALVYQSRLRLVDDPNYTRGQVWEGFRKDWVWESGVEHTEQPIRVSGAYVNGSFRPLASGVSVDYPNGRIVFTSAIAATSTVTANFTYRLYQVHPGDHEAFRQLQSRSFRVDDGHFLQSGSGAWNVLAQNRVQMPAVFVQAIPNGSRKPKQIGGGDILMQDVVCHVVTEEPFHRGWMHDVLVGQKEKRISGFDKNLMLDADAFPLDFNGSPTGSGRMYPDLIKPTGQGGFEWSQIRVADTKGQDFGLVGNVQYSTVKLRLEIDRPPVT